MPTTAFLAGYYGLRQDASDAFVQGYLDEMTRLDQRGQGVPCGSGWISRAKKCSKEKAGQTSKEAKQKAVAKSRDRLKLKQQIKASKGQKPYVKQKARPKRPSDFKMSGLIADELNRNGFRARPWQKGNVPPRIYLQVPSGGARGYLEIDEGKVYGNMSGYGRSGEANDIAKQFAKQYA